MTESEFLDLSDAVFERIQTALDEAGSDVEALLQGNALTLDCESGGQVIVNRHVPNAEIWLAGKAGGFHFRLADDGRWLRPEARAQMEAWIAASPRISTLVEYRRRLSTVLEARTADAAEKLHRLQEWCREAEASGIRSLQEFAQRLRGYSLQTA